MGIIEESVHLLEERVQGSGCEDGVVNLRVDPDSTKCPYEHGVCMVATFGGKSAEFVTSEPTRATTKLSFMFGATFEKPGVRAAACAIINALTGFLCINRVNHACASGSHQPCIKGLREKLGGRKVHLLGDSAVLKRAFGTDLADSIEKADIVLITCEGLLSGDDFLNMGDLPVQKYYLIGPSTSGIAVLTATQHWCPYGKA